MNAKEFLQSKGAVASIHALQVAEWMEEYAQSKASPLTEIEDGNFWFDEFNKRYPDEVREIMNEMYDITHKEEMT